MKPKRRQPDRLWRCRCGANNLGDRECDACGCPKARVLPGQQPGAQLYLVKRMPWEGQPTPVSEEQKAEALGIMKDVRNGTTSLAVAHARLAKLFGGEPADYAPGGKVEKGEG